MKNEKLENFLNNNNGYITTKELEDIGISKMRIPELLKENILRKVSHGIYMDNKLIEDEFYILQKRFGNIVYSYNTACYLLGLSDRAPYKLEVTTIKHNNIKNSMYMRLYSIDKKRCNFRMNNWKIFDTIVIIILALLLILSILKGWII